MSCYYEIASGCGKRERSAPVDSAVSAAPSTASANSALGGAFQRRNGPKICGSLPPAVGDSGFLARFRGVVADRPGGSEGRWRRWLLLFAVLLGWSELALHIYFSRSAPRLAEWTAIRPGVARLVQGEDALIVVAPDWAEPNA